MGFKYRAVSHDPPPLRSRRNPFFTTTLQQGVTDILMALNTPQPFDPALVATEPQNAVVCDLAALFGVDLGPRSQECVYGQNQARGGARARTHLGRGMGGGGRGRVRKARTDREGGRG